MATDGVRTDETRDPELDALIASGALDGAVTARLADADGPLVAVRPAPDDGPEDWVVRLESLLDIGPSARVGVVAADPVLAAAVAARLAVSVADGGRRVVLIDGSVHRPVIAKALDGDGEEGLVDSVVFGVSTAVTARRTLATGVSLMTSGSVPVSSSAVFGVDGFGAALGGFAQDVAVFVALPAEFLGAALHAFSHVIAAGRSVGEIGRIASAAKERTGAGPSVAIGVLAARPHPEPPAALVEAREAEAAARQPHPDEVPEQVPQQTARPTPGAVPESPAQHGMTPASPGMAAASGRSRRSPVRTARLPQPEPPRREPTRKRVPAATWWVVALMAVAATAAWRTGALERLLEPGRTVTGSTRREPAPATRAQTAEPRPAGGEPAEPPRAAAEPTESPAAEAETPAGTQAVSPRPTGSSARTDPRTGAEPTGQIVIAGPGGRYAVFVSSHRTEAAALADAEAIGGRGVRAETVRAEVAGSGTWYRVRVAGGYPTLAAAREALESVKSLDYEGAWIERTPVEE